MDAYAQYTLSVLPIAALARRETLKPIFVPHIDVNEAALIPNLEVKAVPSLDELHDHLSDQCYLTAKPPTTLEEIPVNVQTDFRDIK